jgi:galactose mutarotase-like enzyme
MYFSLVSRWFTKARMTLWRAAVMRSGLLTLFALAIVFLILALGWKAHQRGRFSQLKAELKKPAPLPVPTIIRPGGQEPIILERTQIGTGSNLEFLKATLLPGRGMNLQQITAYIPQKGEIQLLATPPLETAAKLFTGTESDANGAASLTAGSAYLAPWAGRLFGTASADGKSLNTNWNGHVLSVPASSHSGALAAAMGGLLLNHPAALANTNVMPDGGEAKATFDAGDFDGHWPSKTQITMTVQLNSRAIEMRMVARNTGDQPEPIGLGWQPRFVIANNNRSSLRLRLPTDIRAETNHRIGLPTGKLLPSAGGEYDFTARNGAPLGTLSLDDTFVHLRQALLENGPIVELRDLENNYGLRITTLSSAIKALHVYAPADENFIQIAPQFNYDDPFGHEWPASEDTGMVTLAPGQSVEWRIRLEIFSLTEPSRL